METKSIDLSAVNALIAERGDSWRAEIYLNTFPGVTCIPYEDEQGRSGVWLKELRTFIGWRGCAPRRTLHLYRKGADTIDVPADQAVDLDWAKRELTRITEEKRERREQDVRWANSVLGGAAMHGGEWYRDVAWKALSTWNVPLRPLAGQPVPEHEGDIWIRTSFIGIDGTSFRDTPLNKAAYGSVRYRLVGKSRSGSTGYCALLPEEHARISPIVEAAIAQQIEADAVWAERRAIEVLNDVINA